MTAMPSSRLPFAGALIAGLLILLAASLFTVDQRQYAIVFQLGEVKEVIREPGLSFKWPMIQNVRFFDKRILTLDSAEPERFTLQGINFDTGQASLRANAHGVIDSVAARVRELPAARIVVEGHTDIRPIRTADFGFGTSFFTSVAVISIC